MNLGNKIRELRRSRGLTQEQLANALGLSPQAVSKWESEASYPDMTLIPVLANFFDVSLDALFDFDITKKQQKIDEIMNEAGRYFWNDFDKAEEIFKRGIEEYPSSDKLKAELLSLYECHMRTYGRTELAERAIAMAGELIGQSSDIFAICSAKDSLVSIYLMQDRYADAKDVIGTLPYMYPYMLNDKMRCTAYHMKGQDRLAEAKDWKTIEIQELFIACGQEGEGYYEIGDYDSALISFTQAKDVLEMFLKGDTVCLDAYLWGGMQSHHWGFWLDIAKTLYRLGRVDECGEAVDRAHYIVTHAWDEHFEEDPDIMESFRKAYKENGLDEFRPCM